MRRFLALLALLTIGACSSSSGDTDTGSGGNSSGGVGGSGGTATDCGDCAGCCQAGVCVLAHEQSVSACGTTGACEVCEQGSLCAVTGCEGGRPPPPESCADTCSGCCAGVSCVDIAQQDAVFCGSGGGVCGSCTENTLCQSGVCTGVLDPGAVFSIRVVSVEVEERDGSGAAWDTLGGLPDPYVCVRTPTGTGCTGFCDDSTTCEYSISGDVTGPGGGPLQITGAQLAAGDLELDVWDDDLTSDDSIGSGAFTIDTWSASGYQSGPFGSVVNLSIELY